MECHISIGCIDLLVSSLSGLFTLCFRNAFLALEWLKSNVSPVFKKGSRSDPNYFRSIALTCTVCKIMESDIKDQLLSHLVNDIISKHQHAFIHNHSTATNLLGCTHLTLANLQTTHISTFPCF